MRAENDLIANDLWGSKLSELQRARAAEFTLARAAEMLLELALPLSQDLAEVARQMGVRVEISQAERKEGGLVVLSEYVAAGGGEGPLIRVHLGSFRDDPSRLRLAIAHELFHHLESIHGRTGELFIRHQRLGWQWKLRRLRVLSEIAACRFASLVVGDSINA